MQGPAAIAREFRIARATVRQVVDAARRGLPEAER